MASRKKQTLGANPKTPTKHIDLELAERSCRLLNNMLKLDPTAVMALINQRVPVNADLADHPTIQSLHHRYGFSVGILGILNGLIGVNSAGSGVLAAVLDKDHNIVKFEVLDDVS